ncbi:pseudouridine synthase [Novilysobacter defluvii]|uniref:Pseudouridylate synthase n=1 Tax=Lysobacter defluvii IMMIB APB-9 = DSM 18482 TaxID=1385515 RepID=A0A0A0MBE3_9GAMM|nr:pseudouridine synthase [Lysobacter defluvii]KGO99617.1 pseudouridylate synthase [Lysobacter defluvii IMMIB APB-9 = DSM 18482]
MNEPRPTRDGVAASRLQLPPGDWPTVLDALCERFPRVDRATWRERFARGRVLDAGGKPLDADAPYRAGAEIQYFREVADEPRIPFEERVLHVDRHLVVADKPHFLPVAPTGAFVRETLLGRLVRRLGNPDLVPLHRIDRLTAGLVLFSASRESRGAYQALFRERRIGKEYLALAPPLPALEFPRVYRSRLERGEPFFRMREAAGEPNSETRIEVVARGPGPWCYRLEPVTGRKHQLRVHMATLGAPIEGDPLYPDLRDPGPDDHARPLQLLARALEFDDPLDGRRRRFCSGRTLSPVPAGACGASSPRA